MSLSDKFLVGFVIVWNAIILAFWLAGLLGWVWLWLGIEVLVGIAELVSKLKTSKTLTQRFRAWGKEHVWQALLILLGMLGAWVLLLLHLGVR